jgi:hypothetical protein
MAKMNDGWCTVLAIDIAAGSAATINTMSRLVAQRITRMTEQQCRGGEKGGI